MRPEDMMTPEINNIIRCLDTFIKNILNFIFFITTIIFMGMCNGNKILHIFLYNPMIKESGWIPQSIHKTRKGAERAMESHKEEVLREWSERFQDTPEKSTHPIEQYQDWRICEYELLS